MPCHIALLEFNITLRFERITTTLKGFFDNDYSWNIEILNILNYPIHLSHWMGTSGCVPSCHLLDGNNYAEPFSVRSDWVSAHTRSRYARTASRLWKVTHSKRLGV